MDRNEPIRVLVWDENPPHAPKEIYPNGIKGAIAEGLTESLGDAVAVKAVDLDDPDQGIGEAAIAAADVVIWWGHIRHGEVTDEAAARIKDRVHHHGLGFIALHSAIHAKPFRSILDATGNLKGGWREDSRPEEIRVCAPHHPIAKGISDFTLPEEEMYGAPFDVPPPHCVILQSYFPAGGEYFPCGLTWTVGDGIDPNFTIGPGGGVNQGEGIGRVFYFRPGHETNRTYFDANVRAVMANAVVWAAKRSG